MIIIAVVITSSLIFIQYTLSSNAVPRLQFKKVFSLKLAEPLFPLLRKFFVFLWLASSLVWGRIYGLELGFTWFILVSGGLFLAMSILPPVLKNGFAGDLRRGGQR